VVDVQCDVYTGLDIKQKHRVRTAGALSPLISTNDTAGWHFNLMCRASYVLRFVAFDE
jgi:hypothetical protein